MTPLRLGLAYSALARYYEPRDADRALSQPTARQSAC